MKTLYFDSSYLFRIYSTEPGHDAVKALLHSAEAVASSWHARAEFSTITLRKRREGAMTSDDVRVITRQFIQEYQNGFISILPFTEAVMDRIESVCLSAPGNTYLRAADALHLACARENRFDEVYSNDRHFLAAAPLFGLRGINVIP